MQICTVGTTNHKIKKSYGISTGKYFHNLDKSLRKRCNKLSHLKSKFKHKMKNQ
jgi:hypothetical protein